MSSCEENLNDWQKLLVEKNYLQGVFFWSKTAPKPCLHASATILVSNAGWKYDSRGALEVKVFILRKALSYSPFHITSVFWRVNHASVAQGSLWSFMHLGSYGNIMQFYLLYQMQKTTPPSQVSFVEKIISNSPKVPRAKFLGSDRILFYAGLQLQELISNDYYPISTFL